MSMLKDRVASQGYVLNGYCQMPSPAAAEIYARQGFDVVTLDLEHGAIGFDMAVEMLRAITPSPALPFARVPDNNASMIGMLLDAGMLGITCAMIDTAADAQALVRACRYPPTGIRSMSRMSRATLVHGGDYTARADTMVTVFAMVETEAGLRNVEAIAAVPGLDGIYMGGVDLAMSRFGRPPSPNDREVKAYVDEAAARVVRSCNAHGILAGLNATTPEEATGLLDRGFRFVTLSSDVRALALQSKAWVDETRRLAVAR
jgi:4-hydroxy-2-oxoheptanedioate aldolase